MKKLIVLSIALFLPAMLFAMPGIVPKDAVWQANTEADLAGYFLYWGAEGTFNDTDRVDVGNVTQYELDGIPGPKVVLTAYDTSGNESEFSNSVPLDGTAPTAPSILSVIPRENP